MVLRIQIFLRPLLFIFENALKNCRSNVTEAAMSMPDLISSLSHRH
jgi:hypothetical protein